MLKQKVNAKFFQQWSSNMAYILGFIVADGSVHKRKNRKDSYVMNITSKDRKHLEEIQKVMSSQYKLGLKNNSSTSEKKYSCIQISNKEICKDLIDLGVVPRKTYDGLDFIKVSDKYFSDFVRGFFDGDGSVYIYEVNRTRQIKVGFVSSSLSFITGFNQQLCKNLNISIKSVHQKIDKRGIRMTLYDICFYVDDCEKLAEFIYGNNPTLYLSRKRKVFEKWKLIKRRHYTKRKYPSKVGWQLNRKVFTERLFESL
jgi:intein-encoded DNA endonuclease-like protein